MDWKIAAEWAAGSNQELASWAGRNYLMDSPSLKILRKEKITLKITTKMWNPQPFPFLPRTINPCLPVVPLKKECPLSRDQQGADMWKRNGLGVWLKTHKLHSSTFSINPQWMWWSSSSQDCFGYRIYAYIYLYITIIQYIVYILGLHGLGIRGQLTGNRFLSSM